MAVFTGEQSMNKITQTSANRPEPDQTVLRLDYESDVDGRKDWALLRPGDEARRICAVILHGHGSHGDQLYTRPDIRESWLGSFVRLGATILTPNLRDNAWMSPPAAADLHALIGWVRANHGVDRFVLMSGSMGGTGNIIYTTLHPEDVAACVALGFVSDLAAYHEWCRARNQGVIMEIADAIEHNYGGAPAARPDLYARHSPLFHSECLRPPLFLAHGKDDALMPVDQARGLAAALRNRKDFVYREVPGNHDAPCFLPEAFEWIAARIDQMRVTAQRPHRRRPGGSNG